MMPAAPPNVAFRTAYARLPKRYECAAKAIRETLSGPCARTSLHDAIGKGKLFSTVALEDKTLQVPDKLGV